MPDPYFSILLTVHRRYKYLHKIAVAILGMKTPVETIITLSRPTPDVAMAVNSHYVHGDPRLNTRVIEAPFNPLEPGQPERFMALRQWQQSFARGKYIIIWDDDQWPSKPLHVAHTVQQTEVDRYYLEKVYFWNDFVTVATHLPKHRSAFVIRNYPGDTWRNGIPSPIRAHRDDTKCQDLPGKLVDVGYVYEGDRQKCWSDYRGVGKIDDVTMGLILPPKLEKSPWETPVFGWAGPGPQEPKT